MASFIPEGLEPTMLHSHHLYPSYHAIAIPRKSTLQTLNSISVPVLRWIVVELCQVSSLSHGDHLHSVDGTWQNVVKVLLQPERTVTLMLEIMLFPR